MNQHERSLSRAIAVGATPEFAPGSDLLGVGEDEVCTALLSLAGKGLIVVDYVNHGGILRPVPLHLTADGLAHRRAQ